LRAISLQRAFPPISFAILADRRAARCVSLRSRFTIYVMIFKFPALTAGIGIGIPAPPNKAR
jgi:hypothetical protein